ncbi:MAG: inositol monophosphatase family protein [Lautropia sp.]
MHPMLNTAVKAARQAGRLINRASLDAEAMLVTRKERNDFVTEVDRASEEAIIGTLLAAYPSHAILAEESGHRPGTGGSRGAQASALREADFIWIIDPLDGTTNFIHGVPHYCVSIALMERGVITQGLVYDPVRNELFTASRGRGAFLNDRRIRVSKRTRLEESLIGTGFPFRMIAQIDDYLTMLKPVMEKAAGIRRAGAAALDMAYTAAGRFDGFFELGLKPWDVAAGSLLVSEAGGLVGDFSGNASYLESEQVLAGAPKVFSALIPLLVPGQSHRPQAAAPAAASAAPAATERTAASPTTRVATGTSRDPTLRAVRPARAPAKRGARPGR